MKTEEDEAFEEFERAQGWRKRQIEQNMTQGFVTGIDKTTVDGFAEALLISLIALKDKEGRYLAVRLSNDPLQNIELARQVARSMLGVKE